MPIGSASCKQWREMQSSLLVLITPCVNSAYNVGQCTLASASLEGPPFVGHRRLNPNLWRGLHAFFLALVRRIRCNCCVCYPFLSCDALSCTGVAPELRKTWSSWTQWSWSCVLRCYHVRDSIELFGWPTNTESLDSLAVRAAGSVVPHVRHRPTRELRILHNAAHVVDPPIPWLALIWCLTSVG
eukprot:810640-Amphidinium_carterae.4